VSYGNPDAESNRMQGLVRMSNTDEIQIPFTVGDRAAIISIKEAVDRIEKDTRTGALEAEMKTLKNELAALKERFARYGGGLAVLVIAIETWNKWKP
jgi:hypothetical protein